MKEEALKTVEKLNEECIEEGFDHYVPFEFRSIGWQGSGIYFMGENIWTDLDDPREYNYETDEYEETIEEYVISESKVLLKDLNNKMKVFK